jgi:L-fuculose-phosphate aldolase
MADMLRTDLVRYCRFIGDFGLSNAVGGNLSVRKGNSLLTTPSGLATKLGWSIKEEDLWEYDLRGNLLASGLGTVSRDFLVHLRIFQDLPEAGAVVHSHSEYLVAFALRGLPIPPLTDMARRALGEVPIVPGARGDRGLIGELSAKALATRSGELGKHGIGVLLPENGIIVAGKNLDDAIDALARAVENAKAQIFARLLG